MGCNCGKPKCDGKCGISPAVLQINNPSECVIFHKVDVPASMGDSTTNPPKTGAYKNVLLYYEADQTSWLYSSDGIPVRLTNGITNYEDAINLPQINGVTLIGDKSSADLKLADAPMVITIASGNTVWSGADTAEDIYNFFLNQGKVNVVFEGSENYGYEIISAAYIPGEQKMMCMTTVASVDTGSSPVEFSGNALYGLMTFYTADKAVDVGELDLQPKLFINDFTGLNMIDGYVLEGVPATVSSIGMVKPSDGLSISSDGTLTVIDHVFDTVADMEASTELKNGDYAQTLGYHTLNDGGGALYKITDTADASVHQEVIGVLYATLIVDEYVDIRQLGAKGNASLDNTTIIQEAVNKYDKVKIVDGTYIVSDIITLNNGNTLAGNGILKTKPGIALTVDLGNMFLLQEVNNITIDGLIFDGNKDNVEYVYDNYHKAFFIINCENISFTGCKFINFHHQAVQVASVRVGAANPTLPGVKNLSMANCNTDYTLCLLQVTDSISSRINVINCIATNLGEHGIVFYKNTDDITIENCIVDTTGLGGGASNTGHGIRLYKNSNVRIVNNTVLNTKGKGITCVDEDTCNNVTISDNIVDTTGATSDGIYYHGNNATIENNKISDITERGIYLVGNNNIVAGNRINTVKTGCISDGNNNTLSFNIIDTTSYRGMNIQNSDKTYILGNRYSNTTDYACYIANTCTDSKILNNFGTVVNRGTLLADDVQ